MLMPMLYRMSSQRKSSLELEKAAWCTRRRQYWWSLEMCGTSCKWKLYFTSNIATITDETATAIMRPFVTGACWNDMRDGEEDFGRRGVRQSSRDGHSITRDSEFWMVVGQVLQTVSLSSSWNISLTPPTLSSASFRHRWPPLSHFHLRSLVRI